MCMSHATADADYGPFNGHPMDPRTPEPEEGRLSLQPLGDTEAMVEFDVGMYETAHIVGAWIKGEFVDSGEFSQTRLAKWREAIGAELRKEREMLECEA